MTQRSPISSDFGIAHPLENFPLPPCQPPKGKAVLERLYNVYGAKGPEYHDFGKSANRVGQELHDLWSRGDGCIPLLCLKTIKQKIEKFRKDFAFIKEKSKKNRPQYAVAV